MMANGSWGWWCHMTIGYYWSVARCCKSSLFCVEHRFCQTDFRSHGVYQSSHTFHIHGRSPGYLSSWQIGGCFLILCDPTALSHLRPRGKGQQVTISTPVLSHRGNIACPQANQITFLVRRGYPSFGCDLYITGRWPILWRNGLSYWYILVSLFFELIWIWMRINVFFLFFQVQRFYLSGNACAYVHGHKNACVCVIRRRGNELVKWRAVAITVLHPGWEAVWMIETGNYSNLYQLKNIRGRD